MGIKNLSKIIKEFGEEVNLKDISGKIFIDTSIFMYRFKYISKQDSKKFIKCFEGQYKNFIKNDIEPVYIFDGTPSVLKQEVLEQRKKIKEENKDSVKITYEDIDNLKNFFEKNSIIYYRTTTEAEKFCAFLTMKNLGDYVLSNDLDTLVFRCKNLITFNKNVYTLYNTEKILKQLDIPYEAFVDMCICLGCDYLPKGISKIGPVKALKLSKKYKSCIENWEEIKELPENLTEIRKIFLDFESIEEDFEKFSKLFS